MFKGDLTLKTRLSVNFKLHHMGLKLYYKSQLDLRDTDYISDGAPWSGPYLDLKRIYDSIPICDDKVSTCVL